MKVGLDISPLVQTRAGTARHVRGLVGALRGRADLELELLSFGGPGRVSSVVRDTWWYSRGIARGAGGLDVLHCTTFRGPVGAEAPTVVTVHDLAILRHPESLPRWHRQYGRAGLAKVVRTAEAVVAVSEFTKAETVGLLGVPPERIRVAGNGVDAVFTPDGELPAATTSSRSRRSSRARTSAASSTRRRSRASSCGSSACAAGAASTCRAG